MQQCPTQLLTPSKAVLHIPPFQERNNPQSCLHHLLFTFFPLFLQILTQQQHSCGQTGCAGSLQQGCATTNRLCWASKHPHNLCCFLHNASSPHSDAASLHCCLLCSPPSAAAELSSLPAAQSKQSWQLRSPQSRLQASLQQQNLSSRRRQ